MIHLFGNLNGLFTFKQKKKVKTTEGCEILDQQLTNRQDLKEHKKSHESRQMFECSLCKKNCKSNICLKRHLQTHTGEWLGGVQ